MQRGSGKLEHKLAMSAGTTRQETPYETVFPPSLGERECCDFVPIGTFSPENELNLLWKLLFQNSPLETFALFTPPTHVNSTPGPNLYLVGIVIAGLFTRH